MALLEQVTLSSLAFLGLLLALFAPVEWLVPARKNRAQAPLADWIHFWANPAIGAAVALTLFALLGATIRNLLPASVLAWTGGQPLAVQLILAVMLAELWGYRAHRLAHASPWLWRFHRVHHSIEEMHWVSAHRQHPLDVVWTIAGANLPAFALGIGLQPLAAFILFERCYTVFLHANLDCTYGPASRLLASPRFHHWHHDAGGTGAHRNFAGMFSCLDWIFGTYRAPARPPEKFGPKEIAPEGYWNQILVGNPSPKNIMRPRTQNGFPLPAQCFPPITSRGDRDIHAHKAQGIG